VAHITDTSEEKETKARSGLKKFLSRLKVLGKEKRKNCSDNSWYSVYSM